MPMPHRTQMQVIKRRLIGKEGAERVRELRAILQELPGYRNGPFADIRKWVLSQIEETHSRSRVVHRATIAVRREGVAQGALVGALKAVRTEIANAGICLPSLLAATKMDEANEGDLAALQASVPEMPVVGVSIIDDESLAMFKEAVWKLTGLIRVYLRHDKQVDEEPMALQPGATVADVAMKIHKEMGASFRNARIWGPSARFDGQQVGQDHPVQDGDIVEIVI